MKRMKMLLAACAAALMTFGAFAAPTKYPIATVSADKTTLTFTTAPLAPLGVTAYYWMNSGDFERDEDGYPKWHAYASDITTVVFASGFASAEPTDCSFWFAGLTNLVTVTDLSNLNTALVENMFGMFSGCSSLMMLNVKGFNMANVGDMGEMFKDCTSLRRIIGPMKNIDSGADSASMFEGCTALVGGSGTEYDAESIGKEYACVDMADGSTPGYFTRDARAIYDASATTLTFYYDNVIHLLDPGDASYSVTAEDVAGSLIDRAWSEHANDITKVVFNDSFENYCPLHCGKWFAGFTKLEDVTGIEHLDTSMATSMAYMFYNCTALTALDVSGFDTGLVTDMCCMFSSCKKLAAIDVSGFDTSSVTDMSSMFYSCKLLSSLGVSQFDTENVIDMGFMFASCSALTELDLSGFDTSCVTKMENMFDGCSNLKKIYVLDCFSTDALELGSDMFGSCSNLVGGNGTAFDSAHTGKEYARIDASGTPGYFSAAPVAVLSSDGETLTFYADGNSHVGEGGVYSVLEASNQDPADNPPWYDAAHEDVTTVVFDSSFANYKPKHCGRWFCMFSSLTTIEGIEYLDTSAATSLAHMFSDCSLLASVDVSKFNTSSVTDTQYMFYNCKALTELDLSSFDMSKVTSMKNMFSYCEHLENINLLGWNTAKCTNMNSMFKGCSSLTELNLSSFNTAAVTDMTVMFQNCSELVTIYAPNFSLKTSVKSQEIFTGCANLAGDHGTGYSGSCTTAAYAKQDGGTGNKGYFSVPPTAKAVLSTDGKTFTFYYDTSDHAGEGTSYSVADAEAQDPKNDAPWHDYIADVETVVFDSSFADYRPKHCGCWFYEFSKLKTLTGVENLNTSRATSFAYMFSSCSTIEQLDLRGLKTSNVESMFHMFYGCNGLKTLEVDFDTRKVADMEEMFRACSSLTDLDLRSFDLGSVEKTTRMFQNCSALTRIRNLRSATPNLTDTSRMFLDCAALEMIDLTAFDTKNVESMTSMFEGCSALEWIFASDKFVTTSVLDPTHALFTGCTSLKGVAGTAFDGGNVSATSARIDAEGTPGYLSRPPVAIFEASGSMRFYFDGNVHSPESLVAEYSVVEADELNADEDDMPWWNLAEWGMPIGNVTSVEIDASFKKFKPRHCAWFYGFGALTDVQGLEYLDVSRATSLAYMFSGCGSIESVDLSSFDTANVKSLAHMFSSCLSLKRIYASSKFVLTGLDNSEMVNSVFSDCVSLVGGNDFSFTSAPSATKECAMYARLDTEENPGYFTLAGPRMVTFDAQGGTATPATLTPMVDTAIGTLPTATRVGYNFAGWFTADDVPVTAATIITKDATFYAQWTLATYSITYELGGGVNAAANPASYTVESADITLAAPTREGYTFKGWTPNGVIATGSTGDKIFTASWQQNGGDTPTPEPEPGKVVITFNANGGSAGETSRQVTIGNKLGVLPTVTRSGYALTGWFTAATGGDIVNAETVISVAATYFAQWEEVAAGKKIVTFNAGNGTSSEMSRQVAAGNPIGTLPTATRTGYTFKGWFRAGEPIVAETVVSEDFTASAQWEIVTYSIAVELDGGALATAIPATYTVEDAITLGTPTREHYQFVGWTPDAGTIAKGSTGVKAFTANWLRIYPNLFEGSEAGDVSAKGATYNGFIGEGDLAGTFSLVVKKAKNGSAAATMTVVDGATGAKRKITGTVDVASGVCSGGLAGIVLNGKAVSGALGGSRAQGAVDAAKAKDSAAIAVMNAFNKKVYSLVIDDGQNEGLLTATFAAKGKVKIAGTVAGNKVSGSAQMNVGDQYAAVPFVYVKKNVAVSFVLWFDKTTQTLYDVSGLGEGVSCVAAGESGAPAAGTYVFSMDPDEILAIVPNRIEATPSSVSVAWTGAKFDAGKAAKVSYKNGVQINTSKGTNVSGLALKFSKGALSGSFTIYGLTGTKLTKNKFTLSGVLIDGVGYATATNKKLGAIACGLAQ